MAKTIGVFLQKGGVGKSTTAASLAWLLAMQHARVLLVDCEAQGDCSRTFGVQLDTDHAREIAMQLIEAVEAARMDGFLIRFAREEMRESDTTAAMLLDLFRHYRSGGRIEESEESP